MYIFISIKIVDLVRIILYVTLTIENILSNTKSKGSEYVLLGEGSGKKLEMFLVIKR